MKIDSLSGEKYSRSPAVAPDESQTKVGATLAVAQIGTNDDTQGKGKLSPYDFKGHSRLNISPRGTQTGIVFDFRKEWVR